MSVEDYWQENKRFLSIVGASMVVFFIAKAVIKSTYATEASTLTRSIQRSRNDLRKARLNRSPDRSCT